MTPSSSTDPFRLPRPGFPDGELGSWAVLGDLTDRSVRVWVREPSGAADARLVVGGETIASTRISTDPAHDHVGAGVLESDRPRGGEELEVVVGERVARRARFAAPVGERSRLSFAFGSCHQPFTEEVLDGRVERHPGAQIYPRIRRLLLERGALFALWLGDQVYSDAIASVDLRAQANRAGASDDELVDAYRHLYRGYLNEAGYRGLAEALPAYLMWDDHDIFDGWGSLIDLDAFDRRVYAAAELAFREYQHLRNPGGGLDTPTPFGYSFWHGDVGFHVPDLRSERDFQRGAVMGDAGWARLDAFLQEATDRDVPTVFIGASVPIVHASPALMRAMEGLRMSLGRDVRDRWSVPHFAAERTKLVERLFAWQSARPQRQVIVLSGDVHVGAAFNVRPRRGPGRFAQWTSSALSTPDGLRHVVVNQVITRFARVGEHELRVWRRGLATSNNVGVVNVEPAADGGHVVRLSVYEYDARGDQLRTPLTDESVAGRR